MFLTRNLFFSFVTVYFIIMKSSFYQTNYNCSKTSSFYFCCNSKLYQTQNKSQSKTLLYQLNYDTINYYAICDMALIPINSYFHHLNFYFFPPLLSLCSPMSSLLVLLVPFARLPIFCCPLSNLFLDNTSNQRSESLSLNID